MIIIINLIKMSNIKRFSSRKEVIEFLKEKGIDTS